MRTSRTRPPTWATSRRRHGHAWHGRPWRHGPPVDDGWYGWWRCWRHGHGGDDEADGRHGWHGWHARRWHGRHAWWRGRGRQRRRGPARPRAWRAGRLRLHVKGAAGAAQWE